MKHATRIRQRIKETVPSSLSRSYNRNKILDFGQRSSALKPVKKIAKIGTSQTNKARYSFSKARLSLLQALETAQDVKLTKLGNLEKRFSYILQKGKDSNRQNVGRKVKYALQDFAKDQSATALSHIYQPNKKLVYKPLQNVTPTKHSLLGESLKERIHPHNRIQQKQKNIAPLSMSAAPQNEIENQEKAMPTSNVDLKSRYGNKRKPNGIFPSMVDELLSISNARNKLEKLKRLRILQEKLLNHYSKEKMKKQFYQNSLHDHDDKSIISPLRINEAGISLRNNASHKELNDVNKMSNYNTPHNVVYGKPSKRYNGHMNVQMDDNRNVSFRGHSPSNNVSYRPAGQYTDTFDDFVDSTQDKKEPMRSILGYSNHSNSSSQSRLDDSPGSYSNKANGTARDTQDQMANIHKGGMPDTLNKNQSRDKYPSENGNKTSSHETISNSEVTTSKNNEVDENHLNSENNQMLQEQHTVFDNASQHVVTGNGNKSITSLHGITGNVTLNQSTMVDGVKDTHATTLLQKQNTKYLADLGQAAENRQKKNISESHDISLIGTTSNGNDTGHEKDKSYLPLDSSARTPQTESEDFKNPLSSVVSEHDKIISELTSSKTLAKHLSSDESEKSHKTLSKVLQQAQDMFLKKVKEILAGNKTNGKDKIDTNLDGNKSQDNSSQKPKGGVINTSAYVMDESPPNAKAASKVGQDASGIVPKTPTNDDLANSLNEKMPPSTLPLQNVGSNAQMQSLQSPMDSSPPLIAQSVGQPGQGGPEQGHPVSGQPLTYKQLQDAHEEERVALQQENVFRGMQNGINAPLNGANAPMNSATTPYQRSVFLFSTCLKLFLLP